MWQRFRGWFILAGVLGGSYALLHYVIMAPKPVPVRVHRVGYGGVERTVTNTKAGSVRSRLSAEVTADAAGRVMEILRREGEEVKQGEVLVRLDDRTAAALLALTRKELETTRSRKAEAEVQVTDAEREFQRVKELREKGTLAQSEFDRATTQLDLAKAGLASAVAIVSQEEARLAQMQVEFDKLAVKSPFDGLIAERYVEVGEWAVPGKPLFKIFNPTRLYVRAEIDEVDIGEVKTGLPVRLKLDPYKNRAFSGAVSRVSPHISEVLDQNRTVEIEVEFAEIPAETELKPGISADVEVILEISSGKNLRVPTLALMEHDRVLVADGEKARLAEVKTGLRNWDYTEVLSGLAEGAPVIVSLDRKEVKEGASIAIEEETRP